MEPNCPASAVAMSQQTMDGPNTLVGVSVEIIGFKNFLEW